MAFPRPKPPKRDTKSSARLTRSAPLIKRITPYLDRLTVVFVNNAGVTFNTTGFFAQLLRNGVVVSSASFDRNGVVQFRSIPTLTNVRYTIRVFNAAGVLFRTRTIPARVEAFAIIG